MTNYDIIIQAGQSNAEGCGYGPVTKEFVPSPNVFYLNSEKTVDVIDGLLKIEYADVPFEIVPAEERIINDITYGDFSLTFAEEYEKGRVAALSLEEYAQILKGCISVLPKETIVHRITGDGAKKDLIAPLWSADKKKTLNYLHRYLTE